MNKPEEDNKFSYSVMYLTEEQFNEASAVFKDNYVNSAAGYKIRNKYKIDELSAFVLHNIFTYEVYMSYHDPSKNIVSFIEIIESNK